MGTYRTVHPERQSRTRQVGSAAPGSAGGAQRNPLDSADRRSVGRSARAVSSEKHLPSVFPGLESFGGVCQDPDGTGRRPPRPRRHRPERRFHRRHLCPGEKRGDGVGKTKRGKGTKIMGLADAHGLPLAVDVGSASPHEVTLVEATLDACVLDELPQRVVGDKAYDSDPLDARLAEERNVELIAPHRGGRRKPPSQDGRPLRRYRRRWKIERLFAWLQNFRRLVVRYEYHLDNFLAMIQLGCIVILLRRVLG